MAYLFHPKRLDNIDDITVFLNERGIYYDKWGVDASKLANATDQDILELYKDTINDFCTKGGYQTFDIINVTEQTPNLEALRQKFLNEHTHSEDEIRFFVHGQGLFWFNCNNEVFALLCEAGDLLSVPTLAKHWFDMGPKPNLKAIRIFNNPQGWVANYTGSGIDTNYNHLFKW
ncbi:MAG: cupin [Candidatus Sericytochromatia bacterium]